MYEAYARPVVCQGGHRRGRASPLFILVPEIGITATRERTVMNSARTTMEPREEARARLLPGNFQGHKPRAGSHRTESEAIEALGAAEGR